MDHNNPINNKNRFTMNSNTISAAIISLLVIVFLVTLLHIYTRCVLDRQARRQAAQRHLGLLPTTTAATHIHHHLDPPKTGLDPSIILSLPTFTFTKPACAGVEMALAECSICLSILEEGDMIKLLPNCKHDFHSQCIDKWLGSHSTCPICRAKAEPRLVTGPETRAKPTAPTLEGTSDKVSGASDLRVSSFRRMLSREQSSRRIQEDGLEDIERVI